jgi:hypothetical protein
VRSEASRHHRWHGLALEARDVAAGDEAGTVLDRLVHRLLDQLFLVGLGGARRDLDLARCQRLFQIGRIVGDRAEREADRAQRLGDGDLSAILGVTSTVTVPKVWTRVLPSTVSCSVDWSVASTRRFLRMVSDVCSAA